MMLTRQGLLEALRGGSFEPSMTVQLYRRYPVDTKLNESDRQRAVEASRRYIGRLLSRVGLNPTHVFIECQHASYGTAEKQTTIDEQGAPKDITIKHICPVVYLIVRVAIPTWRLWLYRHRR